MAGHRNGRVVNATTTADTRALADYVLAHPQGFTVDPATLTEPSTGYVVSLPDHDRTLDLFTAPDSRDMVAVALDYVLSDHVYGRPGIYLGGWPHAGAFHLEPAVILRRRADAITLGRALGQCSIWDLSAGAEIIVTPEEC